VSRSNIRTSGRLDSFRTRFDWRSCCESQTRAPNTKPLRCGDPAWLSALHRCCHALPLETADKKQPIFANKGRAKAAGHGRFVLELCERSGRSRSLNPGGGAGSGWIGPLALNLIPLERERLMNALIRQNPFTEREDRPRRLARRFGHARGRTEKVQLQRIEQPTSTQNKKGNS